MSSKVQTTRALVKALLTSLLVLSTIALIACDSKLGEEPPPPTAHGFKGTQCLSKVGEVVEQFANGVAKDRDVAAFWDCTSQAVSDFGRYVRGRSDAYYTPQELATFLEKNFLEPDAGKISPSLQKEFMKFKRLFVGGNADFIAREELDKLVDFFAVLRQVTLRLNPYMVVLSQNWRANGSLNMQKDMQFFEEANIAMQEAARSVADVVEKNTQTYHLSDFVKLLDELSGYIGDSWNFPRSIEKYMPIVKKVKKALAGGDENVISPKEWRRFTLLGARGYIQYLRYFYFIKSVPQTGGGYRLPYLARTVDDILSVFQDMVSEKPEGVVSRGEVLDLLQTLNRVWPEFKVSGGLVFESMKIKQLFFGGSVDTLTATDFDTARLKVSRIRILVERFMPFYSVYEGSWDPSMYDHDDAQKFFMDAQFALESTGRELGSLFEGAYDLNDLQSLANEIEALYPAKDPEQSLSKKVENLLPLVIDTKKMVFGGDDSSLARSTWSLLLGFTARVYTDYLYHRYFLEGRTFDTPESVGSLSVFVNQSLNIIRDILVVKKSTQLSRMELNLIVGHLIRMKVLPEGVTASSVDEVLKIILNNILNPPENRVRGELPDSLNLKSVEVLRQELQVWLDIEMFVAQNFVFRTAQTRLSPPELKALIKDKITDPASSPAMKIGLQELNLSVESPVPVSVDKKGRMQITNMVAWEYDHASIRQLNLNRALSRLVVRSFPSDMKRIKDYTGVTLQETEDVFKKVRPFVVELGFISEENMTFAGSRFREANIFTPHADGDSFASYSELADLVGMIWSGVNLHSLLKEDLVRLCLDGRRDYDDSVQIKVSCVRRAYKGAMPQVMTATPEFLRFLRVVPDEEWEYYITNVLKAAGYVPNSRGLAKMSDISLVPHVIQYIEMIFARFDRDKNRYITPREAIRAFPSFKGIMLELAKESIDSGALAEDELLDVFTFILKYGHPPESMTDKARFFFFWKGKRDKWEFAADRTQLSKILGYIADQVAKSTKAESEVAIQSAQ